ncbi:hypothetical protein Bca101_067440 [Brassica carinata]
MSLAASDDQGDTWHTLDQSKETGCSIPVLFGVFEITKQNPDGSFVDGKAEHLNNNMTSKSQELSQAASDDPESTVSGGLSPAEKNKIYFRSPERGRMYEVGSLSTFLGSIPASFLSSGSKDQSLKKTIKEQSHLIRS